MGNDVWEHFSYDLLHKNRRENIALYGKKSKKYVCWEQKTKTRCCIFQSIWIGRCPFGVATEVKFLGRGSNRAKLPQQTNIVNNFPNKHFQIVQKQVFDLKDKGNLFFLLNLFLKAEPDIYRKSFTTGNDKLS